MADYWGDAEHQPVLDPFAGAAFDTTIVADAYLEYVRTAIDWYRPDYLAIGVEVNLLAKNDPARWPRLVALLDRTYTALKAERPDLPIFVTVTAVDLLEGWTDVDHADQLAALDDVLAASDYLALSFYPFAGAHVTGPIPDDPFQALAELAGNRPMAIAETGYPAQTTDLPSYGLTFDGTPEKQGAWIATVLEAAETHQLEFVVNFVGRDYDALWQSIGSPEDVADWRDTGLFDENGRSRPALDLWTEALSRPRRS